MTPNRITIRNVHPDCADLLREIAEVNNLTLGDAFDEAVHAWYESIELIERQGSN